MVREKFLKTLNETIEKDPRFSFADFIIQQNKTNIHSIKTIVKIDYNYSSDYYFKINIPASKTTIKEEFGADVIDYLIECENCPGEIELIEKTKVTGTSGVVNHLSDWLNIVWEELMAIPVNRELARLQESVNELTEKMKNASNEPFNEPEQIELKGKLDELEKKFIKNLNEQKFEKEELESKLNLLHKEIDALKKTLNVFNKKNWYKSLGGKLLNWGSNPENQKMIANGASIMKGFIGNGE